MNVLLALLDSDHVDHDLARAWLETQAQFGWASCALTQNGFVRVISQPRYPSPVAVSEAITRLGQATSTELHQFWPCSVSLLSPAVVDASRLHGSRQVTDAYLLALAVQHQGCLATFDRRVPVTAVKGAGQEHLQVIAA